MLAKKDRKKTLIYFRRLFLLTGYEENKMENFDQILDQWCQKIDVLLFLFIDPFLFFFA